MNQLEKMFNDIKKYDKAYQNGKPIIDDTVFDNLCFDFINQMKEHPELTNKEMKEYFDTALPDIQINSKRKIKHRYPILSLAKSQTVEGIKKYLDEWNSIDKDDKFYTDEFLVERKEDGLTVVFYFNDKDMPQDFIAVTRGGGSEGQDITDKAVNLINIDIDKIKERIGKKHVVIRGEAMIDDKDFNEINIDSQFANSRNAASGTLMANDPDLVKQRKMKFYSYSLVNKEDFDMNERQQLEFIKSLGFEVTGDVQYFENSEEGKSLLIKYIKNYDKEKRDQVGHAIDGLVIKPNCTKHLEQIGYTGHHPNSDIAFKFRAEQEIAILNEISWQKSINGKLTPVGILDHPVNIMGATINRASLASIQNIENRDIMLYDHVIIRRSNDVIPQIVGPVKEMRDGNEVDIHSLIPQDAVRKGAILYEEPDKNEQLFQSWIKFVGKDGLNLDGISGQTLRLLIDNHLIDLNDYSSIWRIDKISFLKIKGFGKRKYKILQEQLKKTKPDLRNLLLMLPIEGLGYKLADQIALRLNEDFIDKNPNEIKDTLWSSLKDINGFGDHTKDIIDKLCTKDNFKKLKDISFYVPLKHYVVETKEKDDVLKDKHFVITGRFDKTRKEINQIIMEHGGVIDSSIKDTTNYLLKNGNRESNKTKKARSLGTKIINWNDFKNMLK